MAAIPVENLWLAFALTTAAGMATPAGSLLVVFSRRPDPRLLAFGLAFAGGAMVYVSLAEILDKAIASLTVGHGERLGLTYATLWFLAGILLVALLDHVVPNPHETLDKQDPALRQQAPGTVRRLGLLSTAAITAHNFPEGMATFFATLESPSLGLPLAFAIAIHNIPEGIAIAVPVYFATGSKRCAFAASLLSGLAEPVGAGIGYFALSGSLSQGTFGAVFGLIAGIMVFLALDELLPAAKRYAQGHETVYGLVIGMASIALSLVLFKWR